MTRRGGDIGQAHLISMNELRVLAFEAFRTSVSEVVAKIIANLLGPVYAHHPNFDDDPTRMPSRRESSRGSPRFIGDDAQLGIRPLNLVPRPYRVGDSQ